MWYVPRADSQAESGLGVLGEFQVLTEFWMGAKGHVEKQHNKI